MKTVPTFSVTSSRRTKTGSWVIVEIVVVIVLNGTPKLTGGFSVFEGSRQRSNGNSIRTSTSKVSARSCSLEVLA